ncbi:hypothetical protein HG530_002411 [Fusarium avenaceum]|nr:hypothetical protein HG530_002411 [Fusarium avenaceum]
MRSMYNAPARPYGISDGKASSCGLVRDAAVALLQDQLPSVSFKVTLSPGYQCLARDGEIRMQLGELKEHIGKASVSSEETAEMAFMVHLTRWSVSNDQFKSICEKLFGIRT